MFHDDQKTFIGLDVSEFMEPFPVASVTDDAFVTQFIEIVPLKSDTDDPLKTECDTEDWSVGDWYAEVKQEILQQIKEEPHDAPVCYIVTVINNNMCNK